MALRLVEQEKGTITNKLVTKVQEILEDIDYDSDTPSEIRNKFKEVKHELKDHRNQHGKSTKQIGRIKQIVNYNQTVDFLLKEEREKLKVAFKDNRWLKNRFNEDKNLIERLRNQLNGKINENKEDLE